MRAPGFLAFGYQRHVFKSLVAGLLAALQYSDRLDGLLACWIFAVWFVFCQISLLECVLSRWLLDVSSRSTFSIPKQNMVAIFVRCSKLWFGRLAASIWHLGGPFWHLGGTLGVLGSSRKVTWGSRIGVSAMSR